MKLLHTMGVIHPRRHRLAGTALARVAQIVAVSVVWTVAGVNDLGAQSGLKALQGASKADIDLPVRNIRQVPLIGLVMSENPGLESKFREAVAAGPDSIRQWAADIKEQYIAPAMRDTDDASAATAVEAVHELAVRLQAKNVAVCGELGKFGLRSVDKLDAGEFAPLVMRVLAAEEAAYRNAKAAAPRAQPTDEDVAKLLTKAGYTQQDFEALSNIEKLSDVDGCTATVKLSPRPPACSLRMPAPWRAIC